jgi:hypothetical protein
VLIPGPAFLFESMFLLTPAFSPKYDPFDQAQHAFGCGSACRGNVVVLRWTTPGPQHRSPSDMDLSGESTQGSSALGEVSRIEQQLQPFAA